MRASPGCAGATLWRLCNNGRCHVLCNGHRPLSDPRRPRRDLALAEVTPQDLAHAWLAAIRNQAEVPKGAVPAAWPA
jgi:hypothetical protein